MVIAMMKRRIADTGMYVSPICLGTMMFGKPVSETDAVDLTRWAVRQRH